MNILHSALQKIYNLFQRFGPLLKAYFDVQPGREVVACLDDRPKELKYTADDQIKILKDFLTLNRYSRPGRLRKGTNGIEVHWVGNPGTSAKFNRRYFETRKGGKYGFGSTHFIIDLNGDIIQVIPEAEVAYSSGAKKYKDGIVHKLGRTPYLNTLSIECAHWDWKGAMPKKTQDALLKLCVHLCEKYQLTAQNLYLHFDITGKRCHRWFVENPHKWAEFRDKVDGKLT